MVTVSYFRVLKDKQGKPRAFTPGTGELPQVWEAFGPRPMLAASPVKRTGEPVRTAWSREGKPYAIMIMYGAGGVGVDQRTVRIDRISVGVRGLRLHLTSRPFVIAGTGLDPTIDRRAPA